MDYRWKLDDLKTVKKSGCKVFSCFSCGGGSTMGYKLAGFDVIGNVEIDPRMMKLYQTNHNPKYPYLMDIRSFNALSADTIPAELFELDILDGSPPCSTFSMSGKREKKWGTEQHFREGQAKQRLDTLFFDFIETVDKLRPKVVIAENVSGLLRGNARGYVAEILAMFKKSGYAVQIFVLNAAKMGVPQSRERVFFIGARKDCGFSKLVLDLNEQPIPYGDIKSYAPGRMLPEDTARYKLWTQRRYGDRTLAGAAERTRGKAIFFNSVLLYDDRTVPTIASSHGSLPIRFESPHYMSNEEIILAQSFPQDYDFCGENVQYVCGMSVPPVMMGKIATEILRQWLK